MNGVCLWPFARAVESYSFPAEEEYKYYKGLSDRLKPVADQVRNLGDFNSLEARIIRHGRIDPKEQAPEGYSVLVDNRYDDKVGLSENGQADALGAANELIETYQRNGTSNKKIFIISSLSRRARETADIIHETLTERLGREIGISKSWALREQDRSAPYVGNDGNPIMVVNKQNYQLLDRILADVPSTISGEKPTEGRASVQERFGAGLFVEFMKYIRDSNVQSLKDLRTLFSETNFIIVGHGGNMLNFFKHSMSGLRQNLRLSRDNTKWVDNSNKLLNGYSEYVFNPFYYALSESRYILSDWESLAKLEKEVIGDSNLLAEMIKGLEFISNLK